ncbi:MAG: 1-acyl-sn-glycerol-3-phosphate acyltransferase [Phycisphaerae bacterium]|nr:1-acyl-sn-glycerol-3-phosphate acyltransferase [Phycisphaerae bacterium]MBT5365859.1 1-acyl-sn-glycerol-3-phosphate acyltransferase [Phycisphaerae bacterium]MBT6269603.1 1-acyl-sn-glycerol-3-phosphate acyltransferase [Phycisphaerae bacterium]MBT6282093.1 1-acyl-sn-glycerol-3-phosphate acyltransferase [Phycisphaerae bacterium]
MFIFAISILITCLSIAVAQQIVAPLLARCVMGDGPSALLWLFNKCYVRLIHHVQPYGKEIIPRGLFPGKLIVVCNHQSPIDPLLIQSQCRFKIRWLMAKEFMTKSLDFVWRNAEIISVARDGNDSAGLRVALKHLKNNGVIGIFPEAGIKQPREAIHPFSEGVGAMIAHTNAPVLLALVDGTPLNDEMDEAIFERTQSTVRFLDLIHYPKDATKNEITSDLRERLSQATGWPLVE